VLRIGIAANGFHICADAGSRAVSRFWFARSAVNLVQLGTVHVGPKRLFNGFEVRLMRIRCDLRTTHDAFCAVRHEIDCPACIATAHKVGNNQLCIGVNCCPSPCITPTRSLLLGRCILLLRSDKSPNLIALETPNAKAPNVLVMVFSTGVRQVQEESYYRILSNSGHSHSRTHGIALNNGSHNPNFLFDTQAVHI